MMLFPLVVLIGILMVGGFVVALVLASKREKGRKAALQAFAQAGGWLLAGRDDRWVGAFQGAPFGQGSDRHADDVCDRVVGGQRQVAFTHRFTTYETVTSTDANGRTVTTQQRRDHAYRVLAVALPVPLGRVVVSRERLGDRLLRAFGGQDIEIEHADFNRRYRVRADDEKLAVDLLNPRTVERLLARDDASLRVDGGWVIVVDAGQLVPEFVEDRLRLVADLLAGVPRFVWLDHGYQPEQV
ncbi:DUF3137 domain-containing protein [Angustibacter luteus]|uniref:DUF3137 domain-containing protein n=1 Tax=Angustibacter luteus TaxID=658456 RepID=A0ABW1JF73_9ACTN